MKNNIRVILVFIVGIGEALLLFFYGDNIVAYLKHLKLENNSWLGSVLTMLIASPVAFLIWTFRNHDKRKDQQHVEENIRQSDFHKIEEWATNFSILSKVNNRQDHETTIKQNSNLQIASIYQLVPYLKGEYGDRFIRPSMEIYRSLLSSWDIEAQTLLEQAPNDAAREMGKPGYIEAIQYIFIQELEFFNSFHKKNISKKSNWIPLKNWDLKYMNYENNTNLYGINLLNASFFLSNCFRANFQKANLKIANFECANFMGSNFCETILESTSFRGATLVQSTFIDAVFKLTDFTLAQLNHADFRETNLKGAIFRGADLENANFQGAKLHTIKLIGEINKNHYSLDDFIFFSAKFQDASLKNANFRGANLDGAIFIGVKNLEKAIFDNGEPWHRLIDAYKLEDLKPDEGGSSTVEIPEKVQGDH